MRNIKNAIRIAVTLISITYINGAIRNGIFEEPQGKVACDVEKYLGRWYIVFQKMTCSWKGAKTFTDWQVEYRKEKLSGDIVGFGTWRSGDMCVRAPIRHRPLGKATFYLHDSIGDVINGKLLIVATDYVSYNINWGCTKLSHDGQGCADAWLSVKARQPEISENLKRTIDGVLEQAFGITTSDLMEISHNNACS